ncbi:PSME3-interacting protein-like [Antedon mediterranea]|uniref:PSME3-interacting protein-like n=1 Tax=Antedon mediterranea TaxID=105859 RepID=UPI003AF80CC9
MADSSGISFKSFISEGELDEKRKKRQEEWDKVRTEDQPLEAPEEAYDPRSLFDRLQEQKDKKQAEFDEAHQFKNMVRGLEDEEAEFLDEVSNRQIEMENKRWQEEINEIKEYRKARAEIELIDDVKQKTERPPVVKAAASSSSSSRKSQQSLLAGAVKRKRSDTEDKSESSPNKNSKTTNSSEISSTISSNGSETVAKYVAVLPGLGVYSNSSDSDSSSDSDFEIPSSKLKANTIKKKKCEG